jgi:hemerythrin-like domain-containing protein
MNIIDILHTEHRLLWTMMAALDKWLTEPASPEALRERAAMLAVALEDHATREERLLFDPLRRRSVSARHLVDMMGVVHDEVRGLFEEITNPSRDPTEKLWTILQLTDEHFIKEEDEVFPLAEALLGPETLTELGAQDQKAQSLFRK